MYQAALWWVRAYELRLLRIEINGKRPLKGTRGLKDATADPVTLFNWFAGDGFAYNLATPSNDVLDVDQRGEGRSGFLAFNRLRQAGLLCGAHLLVGTPSGGLHLHFTGTARRSGRLPGQYLDFKAAGNGYVLLPPSVVDGRPYVLLDQRPPTGAVLDWEACKRLLSPPRPAPVHRAQRGRRVGHLSDWVAQQAEGNRNAALYWAACRAAEVGDQDVLAELVGAAVQAGLDEAEAQRTVASAVRTVSGER